MGFECTQLETNYLVIVEGSKLRTKSVKNTNMLPENNIVLAAIQKQDHILSLSLISSIQKLKTKSDFSGQKYPEFQLA